MYIALIILAVLICLLLLRIKVYLEYSGKFSGFVRLLFFKISFPREGKKKEISAKKEEKQSKKPSGSLSDFLGLIRPVLRALGRLVRTVRVKSLNMDVKIASRDAFQTAMMFGGTSAAVGIMIPWIERNLNVKHKKIRVNADFESSEAVIYADITFSLAIWQILLFAIKILYFYLKNKKEGRV